MRLRHRIGAPRDDDRDTADDEFIAYFTPERTMLREPKGDAHPPAGAHKSDRLLGHEFAVDLVPKPARLR